VTDDLTIPDVELGSSECNAALAEDLGWGLGVVFRAYVTAAHAAVADLPGGPRGYQVLSAAARSEVGSQLALAQYLGIDRTVMTYLLDDLENARLIERRPDPADRRSRQIVVTAKGERRRAALSARIAEVERSLLADLTGPESDQLRALLARAAAVAGPGEPGELCTLGSQVNADG
jgi:DNA-binding MarR family transcriptional regulator